LKTPPDQRPKVVAGAQSIARTLTVLELFTPQRTEMTVADVAKAAKLPKATAHRLLAALRERGYMRQETGGGPYSLGPRVTALAAAYAASQSISRAALPHMHALRSRLNETVGLYVRLNEDSRVLIERLESSHPMQVVMPRGVPMPLGVGAGGKVLASDDEAARRGGTIVTKEERVPNACGIAAPIFDDRGHVVGALDVSGPLDRFPAPAIVRYKRDILKTAAAISRDLGDPRERK
jgi:DNA-binding IclR family transcriptional regulator